MDRKYQKILDQAQREIELVKDTKDHFASSIENELNQIAIFCTKTTDKILEIQEEISKLRDLIK